MPGVSRRTLTLRLRELEALGVDLAEDAAEILKVEHSLTDSKPT